MNEEEELRNEIKNFVNEKSKENKSVAIMIMDENNYAYGHTFNDKIKPSNLSQFAVYGERLKNNAIQFQNELKRQNAKEQSPEPDMEYHR